MNRSRAPFTVSITSDKVVKTRTASDPYKGLPRLGLACPCQGTGVIKGSADKLHKECRMVLQHAKRFSNRSSSTQDALRTELRGRIWSGDKIHQSIALNTLFIIKDISSLLACLYHPDDTLKAEAHIFLMHPFVCTESAREALLIARGIGSDPKLKDEFEVIRGRDITAMNDHARKWIEAVLEELKLIPETDSEAVQPEDPNPSIDGDAGVYEYASPDMDSQTPDHTCKEKSVDAELKDVRDVKKIKELAASDLAEKFYEIFTNGDAFRVSNELLSIIFFSDGKEKLKAGGAEFLNRLTDHEKRIFFLCGVSFDNRSIALKSYKMLSQKLKVSEADGDERFLAVLERTRTRLEKNRKIKLPAIERYLQQITQIFFPPVIQEAPEGAGRIGSKQRSKPDSAHNQTTKPDQKRETAAENVGNVSRQPDAEPETDNLAGTSNDADEQLFSTEKASAPGKAQTDLLSSPASEQGRTSIPVESQEDIDGVKQDLASMEIHGRTLWERVVLFFQRLFRGRK